MSPLEKFLQKGHNMAIKQLSEEQVREWSAQKKDKWWLENIFRGDMPQLTVRSALTGMLLGSVLSLTNLYIGIQTGWTLGVGITSVILSFAAFKAMARVGLGSEMSILENLLHLGIYRTVNFQFHS